MDNLNELDLDSDLSLPTSGIMSPVLPEVSFMRILSK